MGEEEEGEEIMCVLCVRATAEIAWPVFLLCLVGPLCSAHWTNDVELRAVIVDHYRTLDQNMSHERCSALSLCVCVCVFVCVCVCTCECLAATHHPFCTRFWFCFTQLARCCEQNHCCNAFSSETEQK